MKVEHLGRLDRSSRRTVIKPSGVAVGGHTHLFEHEVFNEKKKETETKVHESNTDRRVGT
jgi:hypothetical protein